MLQDFPPELHSSIRVIPRVTSDEMLRTEFSNHSVFLMPSVTEGSPLSLLEAAAGGLAIVASRTGGIPDIVEDNVSGVLFDQYDFEMGASHICKLFESQETTTKLGKEASTRVKRFTGRMQQSL